MVILLEALLVLGLLGVLFIGTLRTLAQPQARQKPAPLDGRWCTGHYDVKGATRVVLRKVGPNGWHVLDEHVVATIPVDDPDYDAKFLAAMSDARARRALFESEEDDG